MHALETKEIGEGSSLAPFSFLGIENRGIIVDDYRQFNQSVSAGERYNVWTPLSSKRVTLSAVVVSTNTAGTVTLYDGNADKLLVLYMAANTTVSVFFWDPVVSKGEGYHIQASHSADASLSVTLAGCES